MDHFPFGRFISWSFEKDKLTCECLTPWGGHIFEKLKVFHPMNNFLVLYKTCSFTSVLTEQAIVLCPEPGKSTRSFLILSLLVRQIHNVVSSFEVLWLSYFNILISLELIALIIFGLGVYVTFSGFRKFKSPVSGGSHILDFGSTLSSTLVITGPVLRSHKIDL